MTTYKIVRMYFNNSPRVMQRGLTLDEAQAHCNDPETSGSTCSDESLRGQWFDGYEKEAKS